ncbi:DUF4003 family protein [Anaerobium acetethylicum]|nr:DUF4003 family protein [Anaerobium acetethylicum]
MKDSLKQRCELLVKNREIMKEGFTWENSMIFPLCAAIYAGRNMVIDPSRIKMCKEIIKQKTGFFSEFRGTANLVLAAMLAMEADSESRFESAQYAYEVLKKEFHASPYLPLSAYMAAGMAGANDFPGIAVKAKRLYEKMKKEHPFLTSSEDTGFAVLFALNSLSVETGIMEIEKCYQMLRQEFSAGNALQALSHVLALGEEDAAAKCQRTIALYRKLKERGCKYGTGMELATLGVLALSGDGTEQVTEEMVTDIAAADEYFHQNKGFGAFGIGRAQRIMYASIMVSGEFTGQDAGGTMNITAVNSITSIIIAEQAAIAAAVIASTAAASSGD